MGAKRVEAASEIRYVSDQSFEQFDYIVVKDKKDIIRNLPNDAIKLVHVPWVKDCLIAGRLLGGPEW
jgi:hypothetical protein